MFIARTRILRSCSAAPSLAQAFVVAALEDGKRSLRGVHACHVCAKTGIAAAAAAVVVTAVVVLVAAADDACAVQDLAGLAAAIVEIGHPAHAQGRSNLLGGAQAFLAVGSRRQRVRELWL